MHCSSRIVRVVALALVSLAGAACSGSDAGGVATPPAPPTDQLVVRIVSKDDSILIGTTRELAASVTTTGGAARSVPVTWTSLDPTIATISGNAVTAIASGEARIVARAGTSADTGRLVVFLPRFELHLAPGAVATTAGDTIQFQATLVGPDNTAMATDRVRWTLSDSNAARLLGDGSVATVSEGNLEVFATIEGVTASANIKVTAASIASVTLVPGNLALAVGDAQVLVAEVRDNLGRLVEGRDVKWKSSSPAVASVDRYGRVSAIAVGGAMISASVNGRTGTAAVNVSSASAASVKLTLPNDSIVVGNTMQAVATPLDATGEALTGRPLAWQSSNPAVATINSSGVITALVGGQTTISVICDGKVASQRLTVIGAVPSSIAITPSSALLTVGTTAPLTAEVRDQFGTVMPGLAITWSSSATGVASVSGNGMVTAVALGTATVRAAVGTLVGTASVTVQNVPVASVSVSPSAPSVEAGKAVQLVATARDAQGNVLQNRPVAWSTSAPSVATVSPTGSVTGVAAGSATVTATIEGASAQASVTVTAPPSPTVGAVKVTLNSSVLRVSETTSAMAKVYDTSGKEILDYPVTFRSVDPATVSVSNAGTVTGLAAGSTAIMALTAEKEGFASVTVQASTPLPVSSVTLTSPVSSMVVGDSAFLAVTLRDSTGTVLNGRTIYFTSSSTLVATVNASGMVRAVGAGTATVTATSEGKSASVTIAVAGATPTANPVASVSVSLASSALTVGQGTQATAVLRDASGSTLSGRTIAWSSSNTAVATVSQSGYVTAVGAGSATITAQSEGKSGGASLSVQAAVATVKTVQVTLNVSSILPGATAQATAVARDVNGAIISGRAVQWAATGAGTVVSLSSSTSSTVTATGIAAGSSTVSATIDGVAGSAGLTVTSVTTVPTTISLPAAPTLLNFAYPKVTGKTWSVRAGDNLQNIINSAQRGDEIVIQAGATFSGNFTLPVKTGTSANGWILIRSDMAGSLPPQGTRVTAAQASLMPKLVSPNTGPALATTPSTNGWWISGIEFTVAPAVTSVIGRVVAMGSAGASQSSLSQVPYDIVFDRVYIHPQATQNVQRCLELNSARTAVQDSYLVECHAKGFDSQAIVGWNGPGPFKIVNNTLAGAGENIMFGGGDPTISGLIPGDVEIRRNYVYTPASWKGVWTKKNLFETKNAQRLLIEGNVFEGSWTDGQVGYAFVLKVANQSGSCTWCATRDITIRNNIIRNVGAAFGITGKEGSNTYPVGELLNKLLIEHNIVENVNVGAYTGDGRMISIMQNASDVTIRNNTMSTTGSLSQYINVASVPAATNFAFQNNIASYGQYGFFSSWYGIGETPNVQAFKGTIVFEKSVLIGAQKSGYPNATFVSSLSSALATGLGANQSAVTSATSGVVIP